MNNDKGDDIDSVNERSSETRVVYTLSFVTDLYGQTEYEATTNIHTFGDITYLLKDVKSLHKKLKGQLTAGLRSKP